MTMRLHKGWKLRHSEPKMRIPFGNCCGKTRPVLYSTWSVDDSQMYGIRIRILFFGFFSRGYVLIKDLEDLYFTT